MIATIVSAVLVLIAALLGFAATKPATFRVRRAASIKARPEKVFPFLADFHQWTSWSPWEKLDPALQRTYGGAASGKGAVYEWEGNKKVGKGRMEITEAQPPSKLTIKLDFLKPFEAHNVTEFALDGKADTTDVTWSMTGPNTFMTKVMSLFTSMDRMIGKDFEAGLANLKALAER